ncbi:hypothetical protein CAEBREN_10795 [Caenorhabditis brenneri]|uniref:RBR-type E3 ubiquitin transferase n=1 Tax=Caenorhabditis brenneri TaxID=135651 RepID=G0MD13_CAEBE|nr:hypothetical protein CAEBREN_10795 [Caenorhabditis brenneri]
MDFSDGEPEDFDVDDVIDIDEVEEEVQETSYEVLDATDIETQLNEAISDLQDVLQVTRGVSRILLQKFKWNKDELLEKFYEKPDTEAFLVEAQVLPKEPAPTLPMTPEDECEICCDSAPLSGLACGHKACDMCWGTYLADKIKEGQSEIQCMASDCKLLMEDVKIQSYINDPSLISKYHQLIIRSYVETNKLLSWCPGMNCGKVVKVHYSESRLVVCSCGTQFCFMCGSKAHDPVSCRLLKLWKKKTEELHGKKHATEGYGADDDSFKWLMTNTKDCPKCMVPIEKNGGCNYMLCKNSKCRFQFCWVCMQPWQVHSQAWYECNKYDPAAAVSREKKRAEHHRLIFYYTRYMAHEQSLAFEAKLRRMVRLKVLRMEQLLIPWIDAQYLFKAVDTLVKCRNTMMFSYVFAYFLKRDNNSLIFEANQRDLEKATEELSGFLERDLEKQDYTKLKQMVNDKSSYVDKRRDVLLKHLRDGEEMGVWEFNE